MCYSLSARVEVLSLKDKKQKGEQPMSLKDLARSRVQLYENIGKLKAELVSMDIVGHGNETSLAGDEASEDTGDTEAGESLVAQDNKAVVAALQEERDALRKAMKSSEEALEESENARASLLEEKVRLRREVEQALSEKDQAQKKQRAAMAKLSRARKRTELALEEQESQRLFLEKRLISTEDDLIRIKEQLKHREREILRLKEEGEQLKAELLEKVEKADGVQETLSRVHEKLLQRDERIHELEAKVEELTTYKVRMESLSEQKERIERELKDSEKGRRELEARLEDSLHRLGQEEDLAKNLGEAHAEIVVLKGDLEKQGLKLDSLERERDKLRMLREAGKKRCESLEAEKQALQDELSKAAENLMEVKKLIQMIEETGFE